MAKNTEAKAPASTPPPGLVKQEAEVVDTRTGEVVSLSKGANSKANDLLDAQVAAMLSGGDFMSKLDAALKAKPEEFQTLEKDFWKPELLGGDAGNGNVLQGVFAGSAKVGRLLQHAVVKKDKAGKPYVVRFNEGFQLTAALKQVKPGEGVRIECTGKSKTAGIGSETGQGNTMANWKVTKISL